MKNTTPIMTSNPTPEIPTLAWLMGENENYTDNVSDTLHATYTNCARRQSAEEYTNDHGGWLDSGHPYSVQGEKILSKFLSVLKPHTDSMGDAPSPELFVRLMLKTFVTYWMEIAEKYQCNDQDLKQLSPVPIPVEAELQARTFFGIFPPGDIVLSDEYSAGMTAFDWLIKADSLPDTVMPETRDKQGQVKERFFALILSCGALINGGGVLIRMLVDKHQMRLRAVVKDGYDYVVLYDQPPATTFSRAFAAAESLGVDGCGMVFEEMKVPGKKGAELIYLDI